MVLRAVPFFMPAGVFCAITGVAHQCVQNTKIVHLTIKKLVISLL